MSNVACACACACAPERMNEQCYSRKIHLRAQNKLYIYYIGDMVINYIQLGLSGV